jgi:hypothetical protein
VITTYLMPLSPHGFATSGQLMPGSEIRLICWDGGFAERPEDEREASAPWENDGDLPRPPREDEEWNHCYPEIDQPERALSGTTDRNAFRTGPRPGRNASGGSGH